MVHSLTRRTFLATAAAGALAARAHAEGPTPDQMLDELIQQNQDSGIGSGFDNSSRNVRLPKQSLPTLSPSTAETTQGSIAQYEAIVAKGGWPASARRGAAPVRRCRRCARGSPSLATSK